MGTVLRPRWLAVTVGVVTGLAWTAAKVSVPLLVRGAIDNGISVDDGDALRRWVIIIIVVGAVQGLFTGLRRYSAFMISRAAEMDMRDRLFAHLQRLHFAYHDQAQTGNLMSRANTDLQQVQMFLVMIPLTMSNAVTVAAVTIILLTIDPVLTLLALGALPLLNVFAKRFFTRLHPAVMAIQAESAELAAVVEESVSGVRVVKGFGAEDVQRARFAVEADGVYDESMRATSVRATFLPPLDLLPNVGLIAVLAYGGHQVIDGHLSLGSLVAFNVYVVMLIWPLRMLGMILAQSQRAVASSERVHEVLAADPRIVDKAGAKALPPGQGELRFDGVTFRYPAGAASPVLDGLDLRVRAGESVALVGPTGCGKTTVARLIPRFYDIDSGSVSLDGVDVRDVRVHDLRRAVGIVFEETFLFNDSVAANIAFADPDADMSQIERAARLAGAHEFISALPDGYATEIGERGFSLSGGQRQRVAIARAILADPRVLILDDATSAVDPTKEHEIRDALTEVMQGRTTLVIAHRPATIALADRVVLLDAGRIVEEGTHAELLERSERYREVLNAAEADENSSIDVEVVAGSGVLASREVAGSGVLAPREVAGSGVLAPREVHL